MVIVETERLRLRPLSQDDAAFVRTLVNDPSFLEFIGDKGVRTEDDARRFLREGAWTTQPRPGFGQLCVELRESGEPIGVCGLLDRDHLDAPDVGFALLPAFRGCGYAFEAAAAVVRHGRESLGVEDIVALTVEGNVASIGVLEKLGMTLRERVHTSEESPETLLLYSFAKEPGQ